MSPHKVYNWLDMDVYLGLDDEPNTINYAIVYIVTVRKYKNYIDKY